MANSATLRIRRVKCRDEMGGKYREKLGNDEIKCAIFSADLRGSTRNSGRIDIYEHFDDGDQKTFNPPKEIVTLDLAGMAGEVELAFSVLLIESQLTEGDGLQKAWDAFVKVYEESLKGELAKRQLTLEEARAVAQPGYLRPRTRFDEVRGSVRDAVLEMAGATVAIAGGTGSGGAAAVAGGMGGGSAAADDDSDKSTKEVVGDAFIGALVTACVMFGVKYGGAAVSALIGWAKDKFFPPQSIKAKIDASTAPENVPPNATGVLEFRGHDGIYEMEWDILVR